jgi:hypothetical protein
MDYYVVLFLVFLIGNREIQLRVKLNRFASGLFEGYSSPCLGRCSRIH